ncbi:flavin reductase family protein [Aliidiomarina shirensis]|uniref:Flavin reductase family protein n=1 Tax=Aliidiomarina shirensis TaxID=1048642 RepID=A0A432WX64_9GAMM|nr:flavin reductase family protein [Aliidiomarina shirensis]RUO38372.1 flavin reductase family protein [Aliidiomarina shirensis]
MIIDLANENSSSIYHLMTQTLIPRPVAWVLTQHQQGHLNLAPFSYFTAVSSEPPLLMFSVGNKTPGEGKDTKVNIANNPYFVVHIASEALASEVTESSRSLPATESELDSIAVNMVDFGDFPLQRVAECPIAFACKLHALQDVPGAPQTMVFGEIVKIYIDDKVARSEEKRKPDGTSSTRLLVDALQVNPIARLGADQYASLGRILNISRPK